MTDLESFGELVCGKWDSEHLSSSSEGSKPQALHAQTSLPYLALRLFDSLI